MSSAKLQARRETLLKSAPRHCEAVHYVSLATDCWISTTRHCEALHYISLATDCREAEAISVAFSPPRLVSPRNCSYIIFFSATSPSRTRILSHISLFSATSPTATLRITKAQRPQLSFRLGERRCWKMMQLVIARPTTTFLLQQIAERPKQSQLHTILQLLPYKPQPTIILKLH